MPDPDAVLGKIDAYYTSKLRTHGTTPRGVDWNSEEAQQVRFEQITRVCPPVSEYSLLDYGCGYGALAGYLLQRRPMMRYTGYDISAEMVAAAARTYAESAAVSFANDRSKLQPADVTVASGIFSVKMDVGTVDWERYIFKTLDEMASLSLSGFSFNMLTIYSDADRMRPDLYYADPHAIFDYCRKRYSRNVGILHDYGLYEFTVLVRLML